MPSQIQSSRLLPAQGMEQLVLSDEFGSERHLYIPVHDAENRQAYIDAELKAMDEHVARIRAYSEQHNVPIHDAKERA